MKATAEPLLAREGGGFRIEGDLLDEGDFHPNAVARVTVLTDGGNVVVDQLTCHLHELHEVVNHTACYSRRYAEALR